MGSAKVIIFLSWLVLAQEVPYKPSNEFEALVDLQFKSRPSTENVYDNNGNRVPQQSGGLPYLSVNISYALISQGEVRFRAVNAVQHPLLSKKISPNTSYHFEMGFIEDLKKGSDAATITIYLLNDKKKEVSKIVLAVTPNGNFLVNGEWRGQF